MVPPVPAPSTDLSLTGKFVILYDRTDSSRALAEGLCLHGADVSVVDTIRAARAAVLTRPVLTTFVWVTQEARTASAVAEQVEHLDPSGSHASRQPTSGTLLGCSRVDGPRSR
jgi:hypothetical protein